MRSEPKFASINWPAVSSTLYTSGSPPPGLKSAWVFCAPSLVRSDSLYFSSLHFSSPSLRVVSHHQHSLSPYNTVLRSSPLRQISIPSPSLARMLLFPLASLLFPFSSCCPPSREKRRERQAPLVTVVPISGAKLRDHV